MMISCRQRSTCPRSYWGKIKRTEGNKKEKPVLKLLRKDGLTE
jgi:hypothetical protein